MKLLYDTKGYLFLRWWCAAYDVLCFVYKNRLYLLSITTSLLHINICHYIQILVSVTGQNISYVYV